MQKLLLWFEHNKRNFPWREESDPYKILIAEKMLQQTTVGHVMKVYGTFFDAFPDIWTLDESSQEEIEKIIKPLGFWRIRSRDFKRMARHIISENQGVVPSIEGELDRMPGIGKYITTATLCFCFGMHQAVIDVNVRRIMKRVFFWKSVLPPDPFLETILQSMIPKNKAKEFNWGMLDFSATICSRNPHCERCFAADLCQYYADKSKQR